MRIGTRGSPLALAQANQVKDLLIERCGLSDDTVEIVVIRTTGDQILDRALSEAGGKGLFTTEIEEALTRGDIDLAVHSAKDMPTELPDGLVLAAYLPREDLRDAWFARDGTSLSDLPAGAVVGTASLRRGAQVKRLRPDLEITTFRGSVQTRIDKLQRGEVQATLLALAGLNRLGLTETATAILPLEDFPCALGQGAITIEARENDAETLTCLAKLDHSATHQELLCERAFLKVLDGSCRTPIAGFARADETSIKFRAIVLRADGSAAEEISATGSAGSSQSLGQSTGEEMLARLGGDLAAWLDA